MTRYEKLISLDVETISWLISQSEKCDLCIYGEEKICDNDCEKNIANWLKVEIADENTVQKN